MTENDYLNELKAGKRLRIKYGVKNHDFSKIMVGGLKNCGSMKEKIYFCVFIQSLHMKKIFIQIIRNVKQ